MTQRQAMVAVRPLGLESKNVFLSATSSKCLWEGISPALFCPLVRLSAPQTRAVFRLLSSFRSSRAPESTRLLLSSGFSLRVGQDLLYCSPLVRYLQGTPPAFLFVGLSSSAFIQVLRCSSSNWEGVTARISEEPGCLGMRARSRWQFGCLYPTRGLLSARKTAGILCGSEHSSSGESWSGTADENYLPHPSSVC